MPSALEDTVRLHNGVEMPAFGLGTYLNTGKSCASAVSNALEAGYRLIDTASMYGNEREIGEAIRDSNVPRDQIFIVSKYYPTKGYEDALASFERTRSKLGVEFLDLYLIHWPGGGRKSRLGTWKAFEELYKSGKVRAIGVSNYLEDHINEIQNDESLHIMPMVNQCEFHLRNQYCELKAFCKYRGIAFMSYMPFGGESAPLLSNEKVADIARKINKSPAQVILRWIRNQGIICIPKTSSKERLLENSDIDFVLSDEDNHTFFGMDESYHYDWDPNSVSSL
uniref:NADP-dependent oxidoreductase domain-containing protein n=1 Tax=Aplanochytrium stocchinoi TaxID=215587 RepID=A0A7S3PNN5_9STRA